MKTVFFVIGLLVLALLVIFLIKKYKSKTRLEKMEYLLDTNIYRNLVHGLTFDEVKLLGLKMRRKEQEMGTKAGFPIVVAMELISHLTDGDPSFDDCFKALCLLFDHTKNYNPKENTYSGTFYPPINVVLPKYFFNNNGPFIDLYKTIIQLTYDITERYDSRNTKRLVEKITIVKEQVIFEKKEIRDNFENFLKSINDDTTDWEYFKKNKPERKEWFKNLKTGKTTFLVSEGFMIRAYNIVEEKYERNDETFEKLTKFYDEFFPALAMNELLLEQLGSGTSSLDDVEDKKWNTINDISIMFAILFNEKNGQKKVLVTEDKNIQYYFVESGMSDKIMSLESFKKLLDI